MANSLTFTNMLSSSALKFMLLISSLGSFIHQICCLSESYGIIKNNCQIYANQLLQYEQPKEYKNCMIKEGAEMLHKLWQENQLNEETETFYEDIVEQLSLHILTEMYKMSIDQNYLPADILVTHMQQTLQADSLKSLEITLHNQMHLYENYRQRYIKNEQYLINAAYFWSQLQKHKHFEHIPENLKDDLHQNIKTLPHCLQNYFFETHFCLKNKYFSTHLYVREDLATDDNSKQYVFIHKRNSSEKAMKNAHWSQNSSETSKLPTKLETILLNTNLNLLVYADQSNEHKNMIMAKQIFEPTSEVAWTLEFYNNHLYFSQNQLLMCAMDSLFDKKNRYVYAVENSKPSINIDYCQWMATNCK